MATPIIQTVGASSGPGTPGEGREDLIPGERIDLSDVNNFGGPYFWQIEDAPIGTTPVMLDPFTATPHFFIDADPALCGSYRIKVTHGSSETAKIVIATPLQRIEARIPSFLERREYNLDANEKGWHEAMTKFMRKTDLILQDPGPGKAGDSLYTNLWTGGRESHNSETPLIAGAFSLNPADFALANTTVTFKFNVVAAMGVTPLTGYVQIYNLTDAELVTSSLVTITDNTNPTAFSVTLQVGAAAGKIKEATKLYECRLWVDTVGDPETDYIEMMKAELRVVYLVTTA